MMRPFLVPSASGALVAGLSLLFYVIFGRLYGSATLAWIILLQASVAVVQMAIVPQAWLYVLGSAGAGERMARYAMAMRVELLAGLIGAVAILIVACLPLGLLRADPGAALLMFASLWIAGSTSHQGYFRARAQWTWLAAWMLTAPIVRLALILIVPATGLSGLSQARLIAVYFLAPDLCRFLLIHLPQLVAKLHRTGPVTLRAALRGIGHNWLYDLGSAIVENGDKILVGALLGPIMLIVYFFARRIGTAIAIAIEPAYAELYRRLAALPAPQRAVRQRHIYVFFLVAAPPAALTLAGLVKALTLIGPAARFIPDGLIAHLPILLALIAIECGVAVNRWSRYVAQRGWMSSGLLLFRLALRLLFGLAILVLMRGGTGPGASLVLAYLLAWMVETGTLFWLLRASRGSRPIAAPAPPIEGFAEHAA